MLSSLYNAQELGLKPFGFMPTFPTRCYEKEHCRGFRLVLRNLKIYIDFIGDRNAEIDAAPPVEEPRALVFHFINENEFHCVMLATFMSSRFFLKAKTA